MKRGPRPSEAWLGSVDSNHGLADPESAALPLGHSPAEPVECTRRDLSCLFATRQSGLYWEAMDLLELLRFQARRYRCSACGENMADCGINVLAQQGNRALVRVTCSSCTDENLLQIIFQTEAEEDRKPTIDEGFPDAVDPISGDELLELHSVLAGHEGKLTELFAPKR
jgi:hypothetical protein